MNTTVSRVTTASYKRIIKPVLFRSPPDTVHNRLLFIGSHVQRYRPATAVVRHSWAYQNPDLLGQTVHGVAFKNPIGLSAGFDKNIQLPLLLKALGFGFMEGGSVTFRPCDGNPRPWFYRLPKTKSLVVHAGLANEGVNAIRQRIQSYPATTWNDFPLNISVAKTNSPSACTDSDGVADYVGSLKVLRQPGPGNMVTLNISCPNTFGGEPFTTPQRLEQLLAAVDELHLSVPLFIKMPINLDWPEFNALLQVITRHQVAGVTIGNLNKDRRHIRLLDSLPDTVRGGLSGKPTFALSNALIAKTYHHYGSKLTIIGVGGVFSAADAYTKIRLGATLVELITGMIFEGPQLIGQVNRGLATMLTKDGYTNISQAIGADHRL
jgi:dihydroorotate dehydrogenase